MWRVSESAGELVLHVPAWIGVSIMAVGAALVVHVMRGGAKSNVFGLSAVTFIAFLTGWTLLFASARMDESGVQVRGALGVRASASWAEITNVAVEARREGRSTSNYLVMNRADGPEVAIQVSNVSAEDVVRMIEFAKARAGKGRRAVRELSETAADAGPGPR